MKTTNQESHVSVACRLDITTQGQISDNTTHVVGMSGKYPGKGIGVSGFLMSLTNEEDLPRTVPFERWNLEEYFVPETRGDLTMYVRMASFVSEVEQFDATLFRSDPHKSTSPTHVLILLSMNYHDTASVDCQMRHA